MAGGTPSALGPAAVPLYVAAGLVSAFLLAPLVVPVLISFSDTEFVTWPPQGFTLRWYTKILNEAEFTSSFRFSLLLGVLATIGALLLGTPAAIGLTRHKFPGSALIQALLLSPLIFPALVTGIALLRIATALGAQDSLVNLALGHVLVTVPYVVRTVTASLKLVDPSIEDAARTLGAGRLKCFWLITRPQIMPGLVAGAIFAFVTSFDNYPVSMWLADAVNIPLPLMIFTLTGRFFDPGIAAIASLMILLSVTLILVMERLTGLKRAMSM
jgi:putative spermidine/putrescine transport system permease protein